MIEKINEAHARKITGMLLEIEDKEILRLIKNPDDLKKSVLRAVEILRVTHGTSSAPALTPTPAATPAVALTVDAPASAPTAAPAFAPVNSN